ncbi:MAG: response regulator transcription factor [Bacteroidota bacterium]
MLKLAFIEDHPSYLKSLQAAVRLRPDLMTLVAASSVEQFFEKVPTRARLDIIFLDINLPGQSGLDALPVLKKKFSTAEIVMLTAIEEQDALLKAFNLGAAGYLLKSFPVVQLPSFIKTLQAGGALISPTMAKKLVEYFQPSASSLDLLIPREVQVLKSLAAGNTYASTASILGMTVDGVKYHIKNIYKKLNVNNKTDAINAFNKEKKLLD